MKIIKKKNKKRVNTESLATDVFTLERKQVQCTLFLRVLYLPFEKKSNQQEGRKLE